MVLSEIIFTEETMWNTLNFLAFSEKIMFAEKEKNIITNPSTLKYYAKNMVRRCQQLLDFLDEVWDILKSFDLEESGLKKSIKEKYELLDDYRRSQKLTGTQFFEKYEARLKGDFESLNKHLETKKTLLQKNLEDMEQLEALRQSAKIIPESFLERGEQTQPNRLEAFYGLIPTSELIHVQKVLFRLTRGNIILETINLDNSKYAETKEKNTQIINKTLIFILSPGGVDQLMANKIEKLLFMSEFKELEMPFDYKRREMEDHLENEIDDNQTILTTTDKEIKSLVGQFIERKTIRELSFYKVCRLVVSREMTFAQKMVFVEKRNVLYSLMVWVPQKYFNYVCASVENIEVEDEKTVQPKMIQYKIDELSELKTKKPPTYFEMNALMFPFQQIVNTYGVPRYKEVNPALFTVVSFPFFFGLMFGDVGHGTIVLILGLIMLFTVKDPESPLFYLKYLVFLGGFFATYCGFIYSEWFASAFALFPSCYDIDSPTFSKKSPDCMYPWGMDYIWYISENETSFLNSFKMKFSIIIGVIQMLFGSFLRGANGVYFGKWEDVVFEAIPQFLFMLVTFGYMSVAIIIKWLTNWDGRESVSIIQVFINFTSVEEPLFGDGKLQGTLQMIFLIVCVVCFVMMLFFKPFILYFRQKKEKKQLKEAYLKKRQSINSDSNEKILSRFHYKKWI